MKGNSSSMGISGPCLLKQFLEAYPKSFGETLGSYLQGTREAVLRGGAKGVVGVRRLPH